MKLKVVKRYKKVKSKGGSPMTYKAEQLDNGEVHAVISMHPILKKHPEYRKPMIQHEVDEIKHWGESRKGCSHKHAKRREPLHTRRLTVHSFWQKVDKRKK